MPGAATCSCISWRTLPIQTNDHARRSRVLTQYTPRSLRSGTDVPSETFSSPYGFSCSDLLWSAHVESAAN